MSSIIINAAPGPSNFERGSERWETEQFGYHKAWKIMKITNFLPGLSVSWLDNIYIPVCPLHSSQTPQSCLSGQEESIPDQLRRYTGELRQSRRGNDYHEHDDHRVLGSCVSIILSAMFSLWVCFVNFCTIKLNKRVLTTGCAAEMR